MELLEVALQRSVSWSMQERHPKLADVDDKVEGIELMKDESHIRSFITHFKIELNNLIGLKWIDPNEPPATSEEDDHSSLSEIESSESIEDNNDSKSLNIEYLFDSNGKLGSAQSMATKINGKNFGLYNVNAPINSENFNCFDAMYLLTGKRHKSMKKSAKLKKIDSSKKVSCDDDFDDGYRSLSRDSFRLGYIQQLIDLKDQIVEWIEYVETKVKTCLTIDEYNSFKERYRQLISNISSIIEYNQFKLNEGPNSLANAKRDSKTKSKDVENEFKEPAKVRKNQAPGSNSTNSDYEEQVEVIDYDFDRRARDLKTQIKQASEELQSSMTKISVNFNQQSINNCKPIDFGAMMNSFSDTQNKMQSSPSMETNLKGTENKVFSSKVQHVATSSSTSTYSTSSHTSTSSYL